MFAADFKAINSAKYDEWHQHSLSDLTAKLKKDGITLKGAVKEEWLERFERLKAEIQTIDANITQAEQSLNQLTYQLYGLTPEEINLIEGA